LVNLDLIKDKKLKETLIFLAKLILLSIPFYVVIWFNISFAFAQDFLAYHIFHFLKIFNIQVSRDGFNLIFQNFSIIINKDCIGWKGILFFFALVLSTKSTWKKRFIGLFIGIPAVFSVNILRIIFMIWVGFNIPNTFSIFHDILWQGSMIFWVLFLWLIWWKATYLINQ